MKKIKVLVLIIGVFCLCGCNANYNLTISNNNNFSEEVILYAQNSDEINAIRDLNYDISTDVNTYDEETNYNTYKITKIDNQIMFNADFNRTSILNSNAINRGVKYFNFTNYNGNYVLSTANAYTVFDDYNVNSLTVNITLPNEVVNNNADNVNENTYTWYLNKNKTKSIYLEYKPISNNKEEEKKDNNLIYLIITLLVLVALAIGIVFVNKQKYKK